MQRCRHRRRATCGRNDRCASELLAQAEATMACERESDECPFALSDTDAVAATGAERVERHARCMLVRAEQVHAGALRQVIRRRA